METRFVAYFDFLYQPLSLFMYCCNYREKPFAKYPDCQLTKAGVKVALNAVDSSEKFSRRESVGI